MRRYILYIFSFFTGLIGLYILYYGYQSYKTQLPVADIYMWGDSRMYWGVDVEKLEQMTGTKICPTQHEGASVYDMLTFVDRVPSNSMCIIGFSECVLFREHESDYNRSGFNVFAASHLLCAGYSLKDVYDISKLNRWSPVDIATPSHGYFECADTITMPEPMPGWIIMYNKSYQYYEAKAKCYDNAIQTLLDKNCEVMLLDFAGYHDVEEMAEETPNRFRFKKLINEFVDKYGLKKMVIRLETESLGYYDLSHLNAIGANCVANELAGFIKGGQYLRIELDCKE